MADNKPTDDKKNEAPAAAAPGGIKAMLPLILAVVLMPVLAFVMTQFVLVPKLQTALVAGAKTVDGAEHAEESGEEGDGHGGGHGGGHGEATTSATDPTFKLQKLVVNVRGSLATRYLMSSFTLVGKGKDFNSVVTANEDQLRDVAMGVLSSKSISDLERPGARNEIRNELISTFNTALGKPLVQDLYITEFAIQ